MDVSVANLSSGQRKIAKAKEKTKNKLQLAGKCAGEGAAMIGLSVGTGVLLEKSAGAKDAVNLMGKDGFKPTVLQKILARIDDSFGRVYDAFENSKLKTKLSNLANDFKNGTKNEKGAMVAIAAIGLTFIGTTILTRIKHAKKDGQIEQKYN